MKKAGKELQEVETHIAVLEKELGQANAKWETLAERVETLER